MIATVALTDLVVSVSEVVVIVTVPLVEPKQELYKSWRQKRLWRCPG